MKYDHPRTFLCFSANSCRSHLPTHSSREIIIIFGSLTTCDPGNIHDTLDSCVKNRIRISVVALAAEMKICREICDKTGGSSDSLPSYMSPFPPHHHSLRQASSVSHSTTDTLKTSFSSLSRLQHNVPCPEPQVQVRQTLPRTS